MFAFVDYFANVFAPQNFVILCLGTAGGLIMGALPGLSPTMAVALLIPFTFKMDAVGGLILLGAVYTSTVAGGAVSAILLKIPGAPANIATMLAWPRIWQPQRQSRTQHCKVFCGAKTLALQTQTSRIIATIG